MSRKDFFRVMCRNNPEAVELSKVMASLGYTHGGSPMHTLLGWLSGYPEDEMLVLTIKPTYRTVGGDPLHSPMDLGLMTFDEFMSEYGGRYNDE